MGNAINPQHTFVDPLPRANARRRERVFVVADKDEV